MHVAHMGYDAEKGFTSSSVDPSWMAFLGDLQAHGVDEADIAENMDFIKRFVRDAQKSEAVANGGPRKKPPPPPAPRRALHAQQDSTSSTTAASPLVAPPPPPSRGTPLPRRPEKGSASSGVDSSWMAFLGDLQAHGIDEAVIAENMDLIKSFVRDA